MATRARRRRYDNYVTDTAIYSSLLPYVTGGFKWEGLPEGLTSPQLERFITGTIEGTAQPCSMAVGFSHKIAGPVILPAYPNSGMTRYYMPAGYVAVAYGETIQLSEMDTIVFLDNSARHSVRQMLDDTANELKNIWHSMHMNARQQKNPWVFAGNEDEVQSLLGALDLVEENEGVIFTTRRTLDGIETAKRFFPLNPQFIGADLMTHYQQVTNRFLTSLGYDNVPIQKKERLITDEAHGNDCTVLFNRADRLRMREEACEQMNQKFGLSMSVEWIGCDGLNGGEGDEQGNPVLQVSE